MEKIDLRGIKWNNISSTSAGMVPKYIDEEIFLKLSSFNSLAGFYGNEPVYEELAYRIGKLIGINIVKVDTKKALINYNDTEYITDVAISPNFTVNTQYYPLETYCTINKISQNNLLKGKYSNEISNIIIFDYIINNKDRHGRNIEINDNEIAPVFDNSFSFCSKIDDNQLNDRFFYEYSANNYIGYPDLYKNLDLIKYYRSLNLDLDKMYGEVDKWAIKFNISKIRINFIKNLLKYRIDKLNDKFNNKSQLTWR